MNLKKKSIKKNRVNSVNLLNSQLEYIKKKWSDLTVVKMPKSTILIMRPRHMSHIYRNQIKTDYETQFWTDLVLNNEIGEKIQWKIKYKKQIESNRINSLSTIPESWDQSNIIKINKTNHKT